MAAQTYFSAYPTFNHDPNASLLDEFNRLSIQKGWQGNRMHKERQKCLSREFELHYADSDKLSGWQGLCQECGISPVPATITQCRKALKSIHVSIVDLIDCRRRGTGTPRLFASKKALCQHIKAKHAMFPLRAAKADGFLCALLKVVYAPEQQRAR